MDAERFELLERGSLSQEEKRALNSAYGMMGQHEERRERRLELGEQLEIAKQLGLDYRHRMQYWEAKARLLQLELDSLVTAEGSYQVTLS